MASSLRPPYHHDVSTVFRRLAAAILFWIAAVVILPIGPLNAADGRLMVAEALQLQQSNELTIVDIRRAEEWRETGVPSGAKRATIRSAHGTRGFLKRIAEITRGDKSAPIGLICAAGVRSNLATRLLKKHGYENVVDITEGMFGNARGTGWLAQGLPVEPCANC